MGQIQFQFCAFDSTIASIIQWGTEGDVGHVDIVLPSWHPRAGDLLGAQHEDGLGGMPSGVQIRPVNYGASCGMYGRKRVTLNTSEGCEKAAYDWALSMIGTPYDTQAIEGLAIGQDWSRSGYLICSGMATGMITQPTPSFIGHQFDRHWRIVTPSQLLLICNAFSVIEDVN